MKKKSLSTKEKMAAINNGLESSEDNTLSDGSLSVHALQQAVSRAFNNIECDESTAVKITRSDVVNLMQEIEVPEILKIQWGPAQEYLVNFVIEELRKGVEWADVLLDLRDIVSRCASHAQKMEAKGKKWNAVGILRTCTPRMKKIEDDVPKPLPSESTSAIPGTSEKLKVLMHRAKMGQALWHPNDRID